MLFMKPRDSNSKCSKLSTGSARVAARLIHFFFRSTTLKTMVRSIAGRLATKLTRCVGTRAVWVGLRINFNSSATTAILQKDTTESARTKQVKLPTWFSLRCGRLYLSQVNGFVTFKNSITTWASLKSVLGSQKRCSETNSPDANSQSLKSWRFALCEHLALRSSIWLKSFLSVGKRFARFSTAECGAA